MHESQLRSSLSHKKRFWRRAFFSKRYGVPITVSIGYCDYHLVTLVSVLIGYCDYFVTKANFSTVACLIAL